MRRGVLYLRDAIRHCERILEYIEEADLDELDSDAMRYDAVLRNLQIIGEAVKQVPDELRDLRPELPWSSIAGIRNRLVHRYFTVDSDVVIDICRNHISPLLEGLRFIDRSLNDVEEPDTL